MFINNSTVVDVDTLWKLTKETESLHKLKETLEKLPTSERGASLLESVNMMLCTGDTRATSIKDLKQEILTLKERIVSLLSALEKEKQKCNSLIVSWDEREHITVDDVFEQYL